MNDMMELHVWSAWRRVDMHVYGAPGAAWRDTHHDMYGMDTWHWKDIAYMEHLALDGHA